MSLFGKIFGKRNKDNSTAQIAYDLTPEELKDLFEVSYAKSIARTAIEDQRYFDISSTDPREWYTRAGFCLEQINFKYYWQLLQYAIFSLDRFIKLSPNKKDPLVLAASGVMGELVQEWKRWKKLATQSAQMIQINMDVLNQIKYQRGVTLYTLEFVEEAIEMLDSVVNSPLSGEKYREESTLMMAFCLVKKDDKSGAADTLRRLISMKPQQSFVYFTVANMYLADLDCMEEAVSCYEKTIEIERKIYQNKYLQKAWYNKSLAEMGLGQRTSAVTSLEACLQSEGDDPAVIQAANELLGILSGMVKPKVTEGGRVNFQIFR